MADTNPFIHMVGAGGKKEGIISIIGLIGAGDWLFGGGGVTANGIQEMINTYRDTDVETLVVQISSYGGDVDEGETIYSILKNAKGTGKIKNIRVEILGQAYSIASVIAMAGDEILVDKEVSRWMIHPAWTPFAQGNAEKLREVAEDLDARSNQIFEYYLKRPGAKAKKDDLRKLFDDETEFSGEKAIELGLADGYIDNQSSRNSRMQYASIFNYHKILESMKNSGKGAGNDQPQWVKDMLAKLDTTGKTIAKALRKVNEVINGNAKAEDGTTIYFEGEKVDEIKAGSVVYKDADMTDVIDAGEFVVDGNTIKIEAGAVASVTKKAPTPPPAGSTEDKAEIERLKAELKKAEDDKAALKTDLDTVKTDMAAIKDMITGKGKNQFAGNKTGGVFTKREDVMDDDDDNDEPTTVSGKMAKIAAANKQNTRFNIGVKP